MKEEIISFENAKLAKEKGFKLGNRRIYVEYKESYNYDDDPNHCESYKKGDVKFDGDFYMVNGEPNLGDLSNEFYDLYEAPTQSLLQKWLREIHKIAVDIKTINSTRMDNFEYCIHFKNDNIKTKNGFDTYEEALEEGLQQALKFL